MDDNRRKCITDDLSDISSKELMGSLPNYFDFSRNVETTAYLNWRFDFNRNLEKKFFDMAKGYLDTSITLIEQCLANNRNKKADNMHACGCRKHKGWLKKGRV